MRNIIARAGLVLLLILGALGAQVPTASPATADSTCGGKMYIVLYEDAGQTGARKTVCRGTNITDFGAYCLVHDIICLVSLNDSVSSYRIGNTQTGWRVRLYGNVSYGGGKLTLASGQSNMPIGWNDAASSLEWVVITS